MPDNNYNKENLPKIDISTLPKYMQWLKKRGTMMYGVEKLDLLHSHIYGYVVGQNTSEKYTQWFTDLHSHIFSFYNLDPTTEGWVSIILKQNQNDETKAYKAFWEIYDSFAKK